MVSEAAQNHDLDGQYGNHGQYVSKVARGEIDPSGESTGPDEADVTGDADAAAVTTPPKGRGRGRG